MTNSERVLNTKDLKIFQISCFVALFFALLAIAWIGGEVASLGVSLIVLVGAARKTGWVQNGLTED